MGVLFALLYCYITIKVLLPIVQAAPVGQVNRQKDTPFDQDAPTEERMFKPPRFPYDGPFGFYSSGLLCIFDSTPYIGGWFGRSCAGPIAPFIQPTPPSTTPPPATTTTTATESPTQAVYPYYSPQQLEWLQMVMNYNGYGNNYEQNQYGGGPPAPYHQNPYDDYGEPIEGSPWDPDDEDMFIESYGRSASKPGFKLGDPNQKK